MEEAMSFVQIMELRTTKVDQILSAVDDYEKATEGKRTVARSFVCRDRDHSDRHFVIVFFDSYEEAMKNSALPETDALSKKTAELANGAPTFYNLDVIEERS
jgi:hypothetical protein